MSETNLPKPGDVYQHYSGKLYEIVGIAYNSEDPTKRDVVYKSLGFALLDIGGERTILDPGTLWHRPLEMFIGILENGKRRFKKLTR